MLGGPIESNLVEPAGNSVKDALVKNGVDTDAKVLLDCTWMTTEELNAVRKWLGENLDESQLNRIVEVNSDLTP